MKHWLEEYFPDPEDQAVRNFLDDDEEEENEEQE